MNLWMGTIWNSHLQRSCRRGRWWGGLEIKICSSGLGTEDADYFEQGSYVRVHFPRCRFVPLLSTESSLVDQIADTMSCKSCLESISLCSRLRASCRHVSAAAECNQEGTRQADSIDTGWTSKKSITSTVQEKLAWWPFMGVTNANKP